MEYRPPRIFTLGLPFRVVSAVALGIAIFASSQRLDHPPPPAPQIQPTPNSADWRASFDRRVDQLTTAIEALRLPFALPRPVEEQNGSGKHQWVHRRYTVALPKPDNPEQFEGLFKPLRDAPPDVVVQQKDTPDGAELAVGVDGLRTHTIVFRWLERQPRLALVVDDLGNDLLIMRDLLALDIPLTYAVSPFRPFSKPIAERAALAGGEVLMRLPIEVAASADNPASRGLRLKASADETNAVIDEAFQEVAQANGVISSTVFTSDRERLRGILERVKARHALVVEAEAHDDSPLCEVARQLDLTCSRITRFIDAAADEATVRSKLSELTRSARAQGDTAAVLRVGPATVPALRAGIAGLREAGVELTTVSQLGRDTSLSRR